MKKTNNKSCPSRTNGIKTEAYKAWSDMHRRVNVKTSQYYYLYGGNGVTICNEWYEYENFYKWFTPRFKQGYKLDKDILIKGNKVYSPNTCCLVPNYINCLIVNTTANGINKIDNGYIARCSDHFLGSRKYIGYFQNINDAEKAYKDYKKYVIEKTASLALEQGDIDWDIYDGILKHI